MKKKLLSTVLSSLLCFSVHADNAQQPVTTDNTAPPAAQTIQEPAAATPAIESSMPATAQPLPGMNCEYPIPAATTTIDQSLITSWAEKAAVQAFDFNPVTMDTQLEKLKPCFTDQGWQGFHDALDKSGNINAIKTQNVTVTSHIDGEVKINPVKENQWKVTLPMTILYQNDKEKLNQQLSVDLLIGRKTSGNLGIMQVIASPKDTAPSTAAAPVVAPEATH